MLYFAYGSNLDASQFRMRCPEARLLCKARLDGYRFCFPARSKVRESAVISIEKAADAVWGVLYKLTIADVARLDVREGFDPRREPMRNVVNRGAIMVARADGYVSTAETYVTTATANPGRPSAHYIDYLVRLAVACDLPDDYVDKLRAVNGARMAA
jgi:hypothetical protein